MTRVYHVPHAQNIRSGGLPSSEDESAARVVEWYEGVPVLEVAILEYCSPGWVEKARRRLGRKPEDGRPISPFLRADEDERHRMVAQHAARGWGAKKIADRLGVAKGTVQRYMPEREMAA